MQVVNLHTVPGDPYRSPQGKYACVSKALSEALGRDPTSYDLLKRHPFDVEWCSIPAGTALCPYHSHSAQWEFYVVLSGAGLVRDEQGETTVGPGDCFVFKPGEAHQLRATETEDLVYLCIADNPIGETCHYPDSGKWLVRSPERRLIRSEPLDYYDGEEG